jgi:hypothetical protein
LVFRLRNRYRLLDTFDDNFTCQKNLFEVDEHNTNDEVSLYAFKSSSKFCSDHTHCVRFACYFLFLIIHYQIKIDDSGYYSAYNSNEDYMETDSDKCEIKTDSKCSEYSDLPVINADDVLVEIESLMTGQVCFDVFFSANSLCIIFLLLIKIG